MWHGGKGTEPPPCMCESLDHQHVGDFAVYTNLRCKCEMSGWKEDHKKEPCMIRPHSRERTQRMESAPEEGVMRAGTPRVHNKGQGIDLPAATNLPLGLRGNERARGRRIPQRENRCSSAVSLSSLLSLSLAGPLFSWRGPPLPCNCHSNPFSSPPVVPAFMPLLAARPLVGFLHHLPRVRLRSSFTPSSQPSPPSSPFPHPATPPLAQSPPLQCRVPGVPCAKAATTTQSIASMNWLPRRVRGGFTLRAARMQEHQHRRASSKGQDSIPTRSSIHLAPTCTLGLGFAIASAHHHMQRHKQPPTTNALARWSSIILALSSARVLPPALHPEQESHQATASALSLPRPRIANRNRHKQQHEQPWIHPRWSSVHLTHS